MSTAATFGHKVRAIRKHRGHTQEKLAQLTDRSVDAVSQIERGINLPSFETLDRLSAALNTPVREFFDDDEAADVEQTELLAVANALLRDYPLKDLRVAVRQLKALGERA